MKPETLPKIETAGHHRDSARALLAVVPQLGLPHPPYEWVAVMAFYAAVHYLNAYIWEQEGKNLYHPDRKKYVNAHQPLAGIRAEYAQLADEGWKARYTPGYRLQRQAAEDLVTHDIAAIEATVCKLLGISPP